MEKKFQIDTGADRTMLPLRVYKRVTGEYKLKNVVRGNGFVRNHSDEKLPILGTAIIRVWKQDDYTAQLECHVIQRDRFNMSLLNKRASEGLKCFVITDQDANPLVNTISDENILIPNWRTDPKKQLVEMYPDVFNAELGLVLGKYHIRLKGEKAPVKHAPRNVPYGIRENVKTALDELVYCGVIAKVKEPTAWLSSMLVRPKKNGTLRICLDPKDQKYAL